MPSTPTPEKFVRMAQFLITLDKPIVLLPRVVQHCVVTTHVDNLTVVRCENTRLDFWIDSVKLSVENYFSDIKEELKYLPQFKIDLPVGLVFVL